MSFVYVEKKSFICKGKEYNTLNIYSDTKVELDNIVKKSLDKQTIQSITQFGIIKTINVNDKLNISFAGNNLFYVINLIDYIQTHDSILIEDIYKKALEIHINAQVNDIEFIISNVDNLNNYHICCIKENKIDYDCPFAYIGSNIFRKEFLNIKNKYTKQKIPFDTQSILQEIVNSGKDESVGLFLISCGYDFTESCFKYKDCFYSMQVRKFNCSSNTKIQIVGTASDGAYSYTQIGSNDSVILEFDEVNLKVLYTNKIGYNKKININKFRHLLIPIKYNSKIDVLK